MSTVISAGTTTNTAYNVNPDTSGTMALATGSTPTTAIYIDSSQNVGIGTTSPTTYGNRAALTVGNSNGALIYLTGGSGGTTLYGQWYYDGSSVVGIGSIPSIPFTFATNNTERMRLDTSGNLLIGTTSHGTQTNGNAITISGYNSAGGTGYYGFLAATNTYGSATNPNKYLRINPTGGLEIINSAYSNICASISDSGVVQAYGSFSFPDSTTQTTAANNGSYSKPSRAFGTVYQNTSGKNMLLMINAYRAGAGNTIYLNANSSNSGFPSATGGAGNTIQAVAFPAASIAISCVILVPPNYYYNLSNDGGSPTVTNWVESLVG